MQKMQKLDASSEEKDERKLTPTRKHLENRITGHMLKLDIDVTNIHLEFGMLTDEDLKDYADLLRADHRT